MYVYFSIRSRYTNRPVANVRPIQSTPVPKTPMNNMQQRLLDLRNAGVTVQKITATTGKLTKNILAICFSWLHALKELPHINFLS